VTAATASGGSLSRVAEAGVLIRAVDGNCESRSAQGSSFTAGLL